MQNVMLIGIDPGKHAFHVHAQDKNDNPHYAYLTEQIEEPEQELKVHMADDDTAQRLQAGQQTGPNSLVGDNPSHRFYPIKRANSDERLALRRDAVTFWFCDD